MTVFLMVIYFCRNLDGSQLEEVKKEDSYMDICDQMFKGYPFKEGTKELLLPETFNETK